MKKIRNWAFALLTIPLFAFAGCSSTDKETELVGPVTVESSDLAGQEYELRVGQALNINTGDVGGEEYTAEVQDPDILEFVPGGPDGDARYNPALFGRKPGQTSVELIGPELESGSVTFEVVVIK